MLLSGATGAVQRVASILATFFIFPRVLHALGPGAFGIWGAAASLVPLVFVADFGIGSAVVTMISEAIARNRPDEARQHMSAAFVMATLIAVMVVIVGSAAAKWLAPPGAGPAYLIAVIGLSINIPLGLTSSAWTALQRMWMATFNELMYTVFLVVLLSIAIATSPSILLYVGVVYFALFFANTISTILLLYFNINVRPHIFITSKAQLSRIFSAGWKYFILSGLDALSFMFDTVIALQILGGPGAARMAVAQRVCVAAAGILIVLAQPLWPAFVEAAARNDRGWIRSALLRGSALVGLAAIVGATLIGVLGKPLIRLWMGHAIAIEDPLLWSMAIWIVCVSLCRVQIIFLNAIKIMRFQMVLFGISTAVALTLKFVLGPIYGVSGILLATAVTGPLIILPAMAWRVRRWLREELGR